MLRPIDRAAQLKLLACLAGALIILRVTLGVVIGYVDYFPPNFYAEFLSGRQHYFFGPYQWAFWIHILFSPLVMISGLVLLGSGLRPGFRIWHRWLGRVHTVIVLGLVAPSGLWMSFYTLTGAWAGTAFAFSSCMTFACAAMGWRCALARQFNAHSVWMTRCYLLLCSAIVLRLLSGAATVFHSDQIWTYPVFAWISTTVPVATYELLRVRTRQRDIKPATLENTSEPQQAAV